MAVRLERVAHVAYLHAVAEKRNARYGHPVTRLESFQYLNAAASNRAEFHRGAHDFSIGPDDPRYLCSGALLKYRSDWHQDPGAQDTGPPGGHCDRGRHARQQIQIRRSLQRDADSESLRHRVRSLRNLL